MTSANTYQPKISGRHTNISHHKTTIYLTLSSHWTPILNSLQQKKTYEAFTRAIRLHLVKDETIPFYKSSKIYVKLIKYMDIDNGFELLIDVVFVMSNQLGGLGTKAQDLVTSIQICEGQTLP